MKKLDQIGRYSICDDRGRLSLRWWDRSARTTRSKRLNATNITAARTEAKVVIRTIAEPLELIAPERRITRDPEFGEVWISYERLKQGTLSPARFGLLKNRLDIYYRPEIWHARMSQMPMELHRFVQFLQRTEYSRQKGRARAAATTTDSRRLHPNTIADIARPVVEVCALARRMGLTEVAPPDMPTISGMTAPADRPKKGRYLTFAEIGALIDAAERVHLRDLLILALGTGARVGSLCDIEGAYVHEELGVINLTKWGDVQTNKRRPIVPISGPMREVLDRLKGRSGDGYLICSGGKPLAEGSRNWTQMIHRLVERAGVDKALKPGETGANWYSIRHTFGDFLAGRVPDFAISSVMGHTTITTADRDRLFGRGSPTTDIYKRRQLQPVLDVGEALETGWWPEIVKNSAILRGSGGV